MARTVNPEEHAAKRKQILDAAMRIVYAKGYERMTIQDILADLAMSSGAFYHYFPTKPAVLEALIEYGQEQLEAPFHAIVDDPQLPAPEKLRRFFGTLDTLRMEQKTMISSLLPVWFADENAIVREKSDAAIVARRAPLLNVIVRQGIQEGVFTTPYPDQAGIVILAILRGTSTALLKLIITLAQERHPRSVDEIMAVSNAASEAIERVLGASSPFLPRLNAETISAWLAALGDGTST